ncbi:MAG: diguanylate cyclase [Betaproteobacteria bacterium]|nr:diguanylate cyclase [Betaproteobacteria bacterium]
MSEPENPTVIARETFKLLAQRRMPPTPKNYQRIYHEIVGLPSNENGVGERLVAICRQVSARHPDDATLTALSRALEKSDLEGVATSVHALATRPQRSSGAELASVFRDVLRQMDASHRGWTMGRKREALERVLSGASDGQLGAKLHGLVRSWLDAGPAAQADQDAVPSPSRTTPPASVALDPQVVEARELLASALENGVASRIERYPDIHSELFQIAWRVREAERLEDWSRLAQQLKQYWMKVELRVEPDDELIANLLRLFGLVVENLDELVEDDQWVKGQVAVLQELISRPVDLRSVREAERGFKEVIYKQSQLKAGLSEAKTTLKSLLSVFVERLAEVTGTTAEYHEKIERYAERIATTDTIDSLRSLVEELMSDTRGMQVDMLRSRDELLSARHQAEAAQQRVRQLEVELEKVSEQVREDQLTGTLNRRGMDDAMTREIARTIRSGKPMSIAVLDLDNFKKLNDTYGHSAGDAALVHLARIIRRTVRPTDVIARYGGEEFVIILSDTDHETAAAVTVRLQRELTKRFFLHDNERLLITFSAGVAQYVPGEDEASFFARADRAMYQAKEQGKNQVVTAT